MLAEERNTYNRSMAFFSRKESYIGLDIGTASVKFVVLQREGRAARLATYAVANNTLPLTDGKDGDAVARMATILRTMFGRAGVTATDVIAALPSLSVFSSVVTLPEMNARDLDQAVIFAAKNYVPSPLKDVVLGWTVIEDPTTAPATEPAPLPMEKGATSPAATAPVPESGISAKRKSQEIFLTAAPKDLVQRYSAVVERLNLRLVALEVESFPLSRSLLGESTDPILLVDMGDRATSFSVVDRGYLRLNQSVDVGGYALTAAIMQKTGLPYEQAEQRKRAAGMTATGTEGITEVMQPVLRDLVERAQNLRRLFEQKSQHSLRRVVLIGGGANLRGLEAFWQQATGLPAEVGNPWKGIRVPTQLTDRLRLLGPSFAVAVGLALREFEEAG